VVDALFRAGCLPHVIAGSSAGAIVAAAVCTRNTPELRHFLATWPQQGEPATELFAHFFGALSVGTRLRNLVQTGALYPSEDLRLNLRRLLGDVTFLQAWQHSHRVLAVSVSSTRWGERPRLLHHLSAPHALVWSAVACSCAFPGLYAPQEILALNARGAFVRFNMPEAVVSEPHVTGSRRWRDGSVEADLPEAGLGELFHVSLNIVSQTNPCALTCAVFAPPLLALHAHCCACLLLQGWWLACGCCSAVLPASRCSSPARCATGARRARRRWWGVRTHSARARTPPGRCSCCSTSSLPSGSSGAATSPFSTARSQQSK
jgi:predicted acylesterase/phospholipase RssA